MPLLSDGQKMIFEEQLDVDFAFSWRDKARIRGSVFTQRGQTALALRVIPDPDPELRRPRPPVRRELGGPAASRLRPRHGPDRVGQVHDAGLDHRPDQRRPGLSHPHHRGPRRVRPQPQAVRRQPARGRPRQPVVRPSPAIGPARRPRRPAHRRDARHRVDPDRADDGRDRPPRLRARSTRTTRPRRSTASSTCSRRGARSRPASSSRRR